MTIKKSVTTTNDLRIQAEEAIRNYMSLFSDSFSVEEPKRLIQELRVHQVELMMQNEELRRTQHELEISRENYLDLYEQAPVGYLILNEQGFILNANLTAAHMMGVERASLVNQPLTRFFLPEDQDTYYLQHKQLLATFAAQSFDMRIQHSAGSPFWANLLAVPVQNGEFRITLTDINRRKQAENIMAASLRLSEYAVNHSQDELLIKVVDEAKILTGSTIGFFHSLEPDQVTPQLQAWAECIKAGRPVIHHNYPGLQNRKEPLQWHPPIVRELMAPVFRGNQIVATIGVGNKSTDYLEQDVEAVSRLANFTWDIVSGKKQEEALRQAHHELESRVMERTSALVHANEQMKKVSFELVWAEEKERERIAAELHDQVGQSLLLAKMKLDALAENLPSETLGTTIKEITALVENSTHNIRSLTFRMRPPLLDTSGIETALKWLCSSISNDYNLSIDFVDDCQHKPLSAEVRYSLYQAVRELLLNVVKHAGADKAQLSLRVENNCIVVHIDDDGVGFNYNDAILKHVDNGGFGLYNVQQRVKQMGGSCAIESAPGRGTFVTLMAPFAES